MRFTRQRHTITDNRKPISTIDKTKAGVYIYKTSTTLETMHASMYMKMYTCKS